MITTTIILVVCLVSPVIFAAAVRLTRAGAKRSTAALAGGVVAAILYIGWDALAARMDWWRYTFANDSLAPLAIYIPVAFVFGAAAGLAGWRMMRAMGWTGVATYFAAYVGLGLLRDNVLASSTDVFVFGPGPEAHVIDAFGYLAVALVVQFTMLAMAGLPKRDSLRAETR